FAVRAAGLGSQSLWYDEGYTVLFARHDLATIIHGAAQLELNTPLHYILLHGWMAAGGDSEFVARLLSVFAGVLTVALGGALVRQVAPGSRAVPILALALLAAWPVGVSLSQEVRMYALALCLALLSTVVLLRCLRVGAGAWRWAAWSVSVLVAFSAHVLTAFVFAAQALVLLVWWLRLPRAARPRWPVLAATATGLIMAGCTLLILLSYGSYGTTYSVALNPLTVLAQSLAANILPRLLPDALALPAAALAALALIVALWGNTDLRRLAFISAAALAGIAAFSTVTGKFAPRYAAMTAPFIATIAAVLIGGRWRASSLHFETVARALAAVAAVAACLIGLVALRADPAYANEDYRGAAAYLRANVQADETVLLVSGHLAPVFQYYYGDAGWTALPPDPVLNVRHTLDYDSAAPLLNAALDGRRGAWVLLWQDDVIDPSGIVPALLGRVAHQLQPDRTVTEFHGLRLLHYRFDAPYAPIPATIPALHSALDSSGRQAGLDALGCAPFRPPHTGDALMEVACFWRVQADSHLLYDMKVSLRLSGPDGGQVAQSDQMLAPAKGIPYVPFGKPLTSFYFVPIPARLPAGAYTLRAIPYTPDSQIAPQVVTPVTILP
ncbi:MAG: glycosyltransferase family 39 protein, partial [Chloroflexi bacterium]|nr:glycosyltransferase family 39 protein [Chloroflexota bacterium]